ncbi:MAG: DUF3237 domain-containing protein [Alphaproteobacteria bacterium]
MSDIETEFVFEMKIDVNTIMDVGATPVGHRRIAVLAGGSFEGPKIKGKVLPSGGDWIVNRSDGVTQLDVRAHLETDDGAIIYMTYRGHRHGPKEVMDRLNSGQQVDPAEYYFRTSPFFETASETYAWMNKMCFVATGRRDPEGPVYRVYQVL